MRARHAFCRVLRAMQRYFFVKAPSRAESRVEVASATANLRGAVDRLNVELDRMDGALRHPGGRSR
jgi:hypothetical protein